MALSDLDIKILEEIVVAQGQCLNSRRCQSCPFRAICLPDFLNAVPPSSPQRLKMAQDVLTHHYLIDEVSIEDHKWNKK